MFILKIKHILITFFTCLFLFLIYFKIKYRFWCSQPVFHKYNIKHWAFPGGIYHKTFPPKNKKFFNNKINSAFYENLSAEKKALLFYFIKAHFIKQKKCILNLSKTMFFSLFEKGFHKCYISTYHDMMPLPKSDGNISKTKKLISCATSKPLIGHIYNNNIQTSFVDYICVHTKTPYQKNEWEQMFYTHFYNSVLLGAPPILLFKRKTSLPLLAPATLFYSYSFDTKYIDTATFKIPSNFVIYQIKSSNFSFIYDFFGEIKKSFDLFLTNDLANMKNMVYNGVLIPFILMHNNIPVAAYFYKNELIKKKIIDIQYH